ncbi:MAG: lipoate--protein ligase family protein [Candidatus Omnitrophica bacterium]|nr:lipoate--protein ligase family protein [Candidatus Omnitrophota bacterium]
MGEKFRLIVDGARAAGLNMAIDEVLLESQKETASLSTLRIYFWEEPSYSIGYFQSVERVRRRLADRPIVRRITGGGIVLHGEDLTFSLVTKRSGFLASGDVKSSYLRINEALRHGFLPLYPGLDFVDCKTVPSGRAKGERICFEQPSCYDLAWRGRKVVGSSQRRVGFGLLHQSSIFLKGKKEELIECLLRGFREKRGVSFEEIPLSAEELDRAGEKEKERLALSEWAYAGGVFC